MKKISEIKKTFTPISYFNIIRGTERINIHHLIRTSGMLGGKYNQVTSQRVLQIGQHLRLITSETRLDEPMHEPVVSARVAAQFDIPIGALALLQLLVVVESTVDQAALLGQEIVVNELIRIARVVPLQLAACAVDFCLAHARVFAERDHGERGG